MLPEVLSTGQIWPTSTPVCPVFCCSRQPQGCWFTLVNCSELFSQAVTGVRAKRKGHECAEKLLEGGALRWAGRKVYDAPCHRALSCLWGTISLVMRLQILKHCSPSTKQLCLCSSPMTSPRNPLSFTCLRAGGLPGAPVSTGQVSSQVYRSE